MSVIFEFRTKFFNGASYFSHSVGKSVGKMTQSKMHLMHNPLIFAQSVGSCVSKIDTLPTAINSSVWSSVIWWHYQQLFSNSL